VNQILVERSRSQSIEEVLEELRKSHTLTINTLEQAAFGALNYFQD